MQGKCWANERAEAWAAAGRGGARLRSQAGFLLPKIDAYMYLQGFKTLNEIREALEMDRMDIS